MAIGRIGGAKGLRGAVRVEVLTDWPDHLDTGASVFLEGEAEPRRIVRAEKGGRALAITLSGVDSRERAEALRGRYLEVEPRPLGDGEYYWHELVGLLARAPDGQELGTVAEVFRAGEAEVYRIVGPDGELLVPAIRDVVRRIDREAGEMIVDYRAEEVR